MTRLPERIHIYDRHPLIDSRRWDRFAPREDDIVIATSYKAGTTWTQTIVANLLWQDGHYPEPVQTMSPWLDMISIPLDDVLAGLNAQTHRRFIKTHLPLDGFLFHAQMKYIIVGRDGRDVFMSMWNHHQNYTDGIHAMMIAKAESDGRVFPGKYPDIKTFWRDWTTRAYFEWETEGFPYWSHLHHAQSWWDYRDLPNVVFVHYNDLLKDPETEVRRIAGFLDIKIDDALMPGILKRISFADMKKNFDTVIPGAELIWEGGGASFMNKGTNGRWRDVLDTDDLKLYDAAVARTLSPECAHWLENGGPVT